MIDPPSSVRPAPGSRADRNGFGTFVRLVLGTVAIGVLAGLGSAVFLRSLDAATRTFDDVGWLLWGLPVVGLAMGGVLHVIDDRSSTGMATVMREVGDPSPAGVPALLAPFVLVATLATHLVGGSAGREGTAVQLSAGLADPLARRFGFTEHERRPLLMVAVSAGFGSVFGVPWAGALFGLEIAPVRWRERVRAATLCVIGSWTAHCVALALGVTHAARSSITGMSRQTIGWVALAAIVFGVMAFGFVRAADTVRWLFGRWIPWLPIRGAVGGLVILVATLAVGTRDYNGLSLPLLDTALSGGALAGAAFAWKAGFTAMTVGSGFRGGEVTPLFVIGATLGASLAAWWGAPVAVLAAVGMVATFGAAANAPLTSVVMGVELFGRGALPAMVLGCVVARLCSGPHHLYSDGDHEGDEGEGDGDHGNGREDSSVGGHR